jgi:Alginate export
MNMDRAPMQRKRPTGEDALGQINSGRITMRKALSIAILSTTAIASPALAEEVEIKPIIEARLRYENVEQQGVAVEADAVTLRLRAGVTAKQGPFAVLVEAEGTLAIVEDYNSGVNGKPGPIIADPQNIELNRAQIQFTGIPKTVVTAGRQRINLDDQRFVGNVGWRQNEQTFDAVRAEWTGVKGVKADVTYAWSQRTIWGVDGFGARQTAVGGDNILANLSYKGKTFGITAFAYVADLDEAPVHAFRLSSKTFGARGNVTLPLGKAKLNLLASYAKQSDYNNNPNNSSSDYLLGEAMLDVAGFKLTAGYEVLGADNGVALSSFQTPFATLHKFNGTADKFLITPANGLRDLYLGVGASPKIKALPGFNAQLTWHQFKSDRLSQDFGTEWNAQIGWKIAKKVSFLAKYADYNRKGIADFAGDADTQKFWAQLDYVF